MAGVIGEKELVVRRGVTVETRAFIRSADTDGFTVKILPVTFHAPAEIVSIAR